MNTENKISQSIDNQLVEWRKKFAKEIPERVGLAFYTNEKGETEVEVYLHSSCKIQKKVAFLHILKKYKNMETLEIIRNTKRLPLSQQMLIAERIIHSIRHREQSSMEAAAEHLYADYMTDKNLTVFTQLDCENFYETR